MPSATLSASLSYTPPLATAPVTIPLNGTETYTPISVGTLDIPIGQAANSVFPIPFGSIGTADVLIVKNRGNQDLGVRLNGLPASPALLYQIPPNGQLAIFHPVASGGSPLSSAEIETTVLQASVVGQVDYFVLGAS